MKILFSEVRSKTYLLDLVAKKLMEDGHQIYWVVQNKAYMPKNGNKYILPYPKKSQLKHVSCDFFSEVANSDRMTKFYGGNARHYPYYWELLNEIFEEIKPDFVFGELSNFHTHFICEIARQHGIPYLDPETSRYPVGRFRFHLYDRCKAFISNDESNATEELGSVRNGISDGSVVPEYMLQAKSHLASIRKFSIKIKLLLEYLKGEKYTTPSIFILPYIKYTKIKRIKEWRSVSVPFDKVLSKKKKILLYPMQMQPEFNIDVWGSEYNKQGELISELSKKMPEDWVIAVKPNPKAYLDISNEILKLSLKENVFLLDFNIPMHTIADKVDEVLTVTGTVALERSILNKRCYLLGDTDFAQLKNIIKIRDIDELIYAISSEDYVLKASCGVDALEYMYKTSFKGWISEPVANSNCLSEENINLIHNAFKYVLNEKNTH